MPKKTLFLDWNKTLSNSFFWGQFGDTSNQYHEFYAKIYQWLFKEHSDLINDWMYGKLTSENICEQMSDGIGLSSEILIKELDYSCRKMTFVSEELPSLIKKIRSKGIECVIATDNMDTFRRFTIPGMTLDDLFDDYLISCELGVYKYDVDGDNIPFFDDYLKKKNLSYKDVILLDDSIDQEGNYEHLGFDIFYVNNPEDLVLKLSEYAN